ncbi:hypothetical protein PFISCL1PPCAC_13436, partial [Pristionchus fissidentatus]
LRYICRKFAAHPSLTILISFHFLWTYLTCIIVFVDHLYTAYLLSTMKIFLKRITIDNNKFIHIQASMFMMSFERTSMFMMSFERRSASLTFRTYERTSHFYGYKLTGAHVLIASLFSGALYFTYGYDQKHVVYCTVTTPRGKSTQQIVAIIVFVMEFWTIFTFMRLLKINRKRLESGDLFTLSERYQISENIRMMRIILPV